MEGLPDGLSVKDDPAGKLLYISGKVSAGAAAKAYPYTVSTTGGHSTAKFTDTLIVRRRSIFKLRSRFQLFRREIQFFQYRGGIFGIHQKSRRGRLCGRKRFHDGRRERHPDTVSTYAAFKAAVQASAAK